MNKKGQITETLTWFPAVLIIFFIMIIFIMFSLTIRPFRDAPVGIADDSKISLEAKRELFRISNSLIDFDGNKVLFREAFLFKLKEFNKRGKGGGWGDINNQEDFRKLFLNFKENSCRDFFFETNLWVLGMFKNTPASAQKIEGLWGSPYNFPRTFKEAFSGWNATNYQNPEKNKFGEYGLYLGGCK